MIPSLHRAAIGTHKVEGEDPVRGWSRLRSRPDYDSIPPRTTWKSISPRGSDRTMVGKWTSVRFSVFLNATHRDEALQWGMHCQKFTRDKVGWPSGPLGVPSAGGGRKLFS